MRFFVCVFLVRAFSVCVFCVLFFLCVILCGCVFWCVFLCMFLLRVFLCVFVGCVSCVCCLCVCVCVFLVRVFFVIVAVLVIVIVIGIVIVIVDVISIVVVVWSFPVPEIGYQKTGPFSPRPRGNAVCTFLFFGESASFWVSDCKSVGVIPSLGTDTRLQGELGREIPRLHWQHDINNTGRHSSTLCRYDAPWRERI